MAASETLPETTWVCQACLADQTLKAMNCDLEEVRVCNVCAGTTRSALTAATIARLIAEILPEHFEIDYQLHPGYEMTLDEIVGRAIGSDSEVIRRAVAEALEDENAGEEDFYWPGQEYMRAQSPFDSEDHERWYVVGSWRRIADELAHGQRYFNDAARGFFERLIEEALGAVDPERPGTPAVVTIHDAGTSFYRARVAADELDARRILEDPEAGLGVAPRERAANNRMSPAGVPLLYVSKHVDTCIAEVRPSIGDTVVVGRFESTKPLRFFDFTMLDRWLAYEPLSLLDASYRGRSELRILLHYLHDEISRPVRAGDTGYVPTQALAEFIRGEKNWGFDGIAFQSVQHQGGVNYVLFDRGLPESIHWHGWHPTFHVQICREEVYRHVVERVHFIHRRQGECTPSER